MLGRGIIFVVSLSRVLKGSGVHFSGKRGIFTHFSLYHGITLTLSNDNVSLVDFLTARKMRSCLSILAQQWD